MCVDISFLGNSFLFSFAAAVTAQNNDKCSLLARAVCVCARACVCVCVLCARANLINFKPLMIVLPLVDTFAAWYSALLQAVSLYLCVCLCVCVCACLCVLSGFFIREGLPNKIRLASKWSWR